MSKCKLRIALLLSAGYNSASFRVGMSAAPAAPKATPNTPGTPKARMNMPTSDTEGAKLRMTSAAAMKPHDGKKGSAKYYEHLPYLDSVGGEDAYFETAGCIGVADGVGGAGPKSGQLSRMIMYYAKERAKKLATRSEGRVTAKEKAKEIVYSACGDVMRLQEFNHSSMATTVGLWCLDSENKKLHGYNLGDSGVFLVRKSHIETSVFPSNQIVRRTSTQQSSFNTPFQFPYDSLEEGDAFEWDVEAGDVVVSASDGLFDNLHADEIRSVLQSSADFGNVGMAQNLAARAYEKSKSKEVPDEPRRVSMVAKGAIFPPWSTIPFIQERARAYGIDKMTTSDWWGKQDDITVVVSTVHAAA